jgi:3alpha(or 20beta)-hydroxysteroid dehydrogenase
MPGRLKGKVAIITGATGGLGAEEVRLFTEEGAKVVIADISRERVEALAVDIEAVGGEALPLVLDSSKQEDWEAAITAVDERFGRIDVLINNGGVISPAGIEAAEMGDWNRIVSINQTGTWLGMKHSVALMRRSGQGGSIINLSSIYGVLGSGAFAAYSGTKGAVRMLTKTAAIEFAKDNIRVNSILPGLIDTPMNKTLLDELGDQHPTILKTPLGRSGKPREIAYGALFLASDESSYITGTDLVIDGGRTAH